MKFYLKNNDVDHIYASCITLTVFAYEEIKYFMLQKCLIFKNMDFGFFSLFIIMQIYFFSINI